MKYNQTLQYDISQFWHAVVNLYYVSGVQKKFVHYLIKPTGFLV